MVNMKLHKLDAVFADLRVVKRRVSMFTMASCVKVEAKISENLKNQKRKFPQDLRNFHSLQ